MAAAPTRACPSSVVRVNELFRRCEGEQKVVSTMMKGTITNAMRYQREFIHGRGAHEGVPELGCPGERTFSPVRGRTKGREHDDERNDHERDEVPEGVHPWPRRPRGRARARLSG